jgi:hypothetical protein
LSLTNGLLNFFRFFFKAFFDPTEIKEEEADVDLAKASNHVQHENVLSEWRALHPVINILKNNERNNAQVYNEADHHDELIPHSK